MNIIDSLRERQDHINFSIDSKEKGEKRETNNNCGNGKTVTNITDMNLMIIITLNVAV